MPLGPELRRARLEAKLTQQEVAAKAEMDRAYISELERGLASPSVDRLFRLCAALGIKASVLIARVERSRTQGR